MIRATGFLVFILLVVNSVSANEIIGVLGNANMDNAIDDKDIKFLEDILKGSNEPTDLADANLDGKVDEGDIAQIERIIQGDAQSIAIVDDEGSKIAVKQPVNRIVLIPHNMYLYEELRALDAEDMVVGTTESFVNSSNTWEYSSRYFPKLAEVDSIGTIDEPNTEVILSLEPDVIITDGHAASLKGNEDLFGIPIIIMDVRLSNFENNTRKYGYLLNRRDEAESYIKWWKGWESIIGNATKDLSEDKKPLAFVTFYNSPGITDFYLVGEGNMRAEVIRKGGGRNMGDYVGINGSGVNVDTEWVLSQNPPYIIAITGNRYLGYDIENSTNVKELRDELVQNTKLAGIDAVKNGNVYMTSGYISIGGANGLLGALYHAKQFHPDLFKDIDPRTMHQEYLDKFQHVDFDAQTKGLFVYPPPEE